VWPTRSIGGGALAIFPTGRRSEACAAALDAAAQAQEVVRVLNERRLKEGSPTSEMYLGLHVGEVFYGKIGSKERLDFTLVGPAVNKVSRITAMGGVMSGRRSLIKGYFRGCAGRGCGHVSGLLRGQLDPPALMLSADPLPRSEQRA
jgi:hypothetical protein